MERIFALLSGLVILTTVALSDSCYATLPTPILAADQEMVNIKTIELEGEQNDQLAAYSVLSKKTENLNLDLDVARKKLESDTTLASHGAISKEQLRNSQLVFEQISSQFDELTLKVSIDEARVRVTQQQLLTEGNPSKSYLREYTIARRDFLKFRIAYEKIESKVFAGELEYFRKHYENGKLLLKKGALNQAAVDQRASEFRNSEVRTLEHEELIHGLEASLNGIERTLLRI